jgi:hypothetical protein
MSNSPATGLAVLAVLTLAIATAIVWLALAGLALANGAALPTLSEAALVGTVWSGLAIVGGLLLGWLIRRHQRDDGR